MADESPSLCPICRLPVAPQVFDYGDKRRIDCIACLPYSISGSALAVLAARPLASQPNYLLAHALRQEPRDEEIPLVTSDWLRETFPKLHPDSPTEQVDQLFRHIGFKLRASSESERVYMPFAEVTAVAGAVTTEEARAAIQDAGARGLVGSRMVNTGLLAPAPIGVEAWLTGKGWEQFERQRLAESGDLHIIGRDLVVDIEVPAADRIVRLDHNSDPYTEAMASLDRVMKEIREDRTNSGPDPEVKDRIMREVTAGRELLRGLTVNVGKVQAVLLTALAFIGVAFAEGVISEAAASAYQKISALLGLG